MGETENKGRTRDLLLSRQQGRKGSPSRHLPEEGGCRLGMVNPRAGSS